MVSYGSTTAVGILRGERDPLLGARGEAASAMQAICDHDGVYIRQRAALWDEALGCCASDSQFDIFGRPDGYAVRIDDATPRARAEAINT